MLRIVVVQEIMWMTKRLMREKIYTKEKGVDQRLDG
jgi:hypothetical protein